VVVKGQHLEKYLPKYVELWALKYGGRWIDKSAVKNKLNFLSMPDAPPSAQEVQTVTSEGTSSNEQLSSRMEKLY
jgi:hypothetical protein